MSDEVEHVKAICANIKRLKKLGWLSLEPTAHAGKRLRIIEADSSGIHDGFCDSDGGYWTMSVRENWPSNPLLVKIFREGT